MKSGQDIQAKPLRSAESALACPYAVMLLIISCLGGSQCINPVHREYTSQIQRHYDGPEQLDLIDIAEATYPPREEVLTQVYDDSLPLADENLWWFDWTDGILVPYAITSDAIAYYTDLIFDWRESAEAGNEVYFRRANVLYEANITRYQTYESDGQVFEDVFVVTMRLEWVAIRAPLWGHVWFKDRTVILSPEGVVLLVLGDGPTDVYVSKSEEVLSGTIPKPREGS